MKPVNLHLDSVTLEDIENHKLITTAELIRDLNNLKKFNAKNNKNSFAGNPFLYHFQLKNLLDCRRGENGKTISNIFFDRQARTILINSTRMRNRGGRTAAGNVFECFRINYGAVVMFKATTAKYMYQKYGATSVLDPTAGWGGRMLGAWALGIKYTGIDTNNKMIPAYDDMRIFLSEQDEVGLESTYKQYRMIWESCLDVDFSRIKYDHVLTSPPYINLELYPFMEPWESDRQYYYHFLFPLWEKCMKHIKKGGHVCLNISPKMYEDALEYGITKCDKEEPLKQQLGQKMNKKKQDMIYVWKRK
jgi:hypothetical protein